MMQISDLKFEVVDCAIEAYCFSETMKWDFIINCQSHSDRKLGDFSPSLSLSLFETPPGAFSHWSQLAPREVHWIEKNSTDDTPYGLLDVFEHTLIYESTAYCYHDLGQMRIKVDAKCDILYNAEYGNNLKLNLDSPVRFQGAWFGRRDEVECRAMISKFLDPDDFNFERTEYGVSVLTPKPLA